MTISRALLTFSLWMSFGLTLVACSPQDVTDDGQVPAATTPAPSNSPTASPISSTLPPTVDAKTAARTEAKLGIQLTASSAFLVHSSLTLVVQGAALGIPQERLRDSLGTALGECQLFADRYEARFLPTLDIWPKPYRDLWFARITACNAISSTEGWDALLRQPDYCECLLVEFVALTPLSEARDGLPDYSDAQLDRAISERQ